MPITLAKDVDGWSIIPEHTNGRDVWLDPTRPDDTGDGLTKGNAKKTLGAACDEIRDGFDDHLVIVEGSTITSGDLDNMIGKSGPGPSNPIIVYTENWDVDGCATSGRAVYNAPSEEFFKAVNTSTPDFGNWAIIGLEVTESGYAGTQKPAAFAANTKITDVYNILWEDCYIHDRSGFSIGHNGGAGALDFDWEFRRCTFYQCFHTLVHMQNFFMTRINKCLWWECALLRGGWDNNLQHRNIFDRNIYASASCGDDLKADRTLLLDGSSEVQFRSGGTLTNCMVENNPFSLDIGYGYSNPSDANSNNRVDGFNAVVEDCVFMDSINSDSSTPGDGGAPRGLRINMANVTTTKVGSFQRNIVTRDRASTSNQDGLVIRMLDDKNSTGVITNPQILNNGFHNTTIAYNVFWDINNRALHARLNEGTGSVTNCTVTGNKFSTYGSGDIIDQDGNISLSNWSYSGNQYWHPTRSKNDSGLFEYNGTSRDFDTWKNVVENNATWVNPNYTDATRNLAKYHSTIMGGAESRSAMYTAILGNRKANWDARLTAPAINDWIREGFDMDAVEDPPPPPPPPVETGYHVIKAGTKYLSIEN